jgi:hypothetical protein
MKGFIAMLSLMILLSAYPALAEPHGGPPGGRLLDRLVEPCHAKCFDQVRSCRDAAEASTLNDLQSPTNACATQIAVAQSACATDHASQGCQAAKSALRSCAQNDLSKLRVALYNCRNPEVVEQCVAVCNSQQ